MPGPADYILMAFGLAVALFAVAALAVGLWVLAGEGLRLARRAATAGGRRRRGACLDCGYSLHANPSGRTSASSVESCPECGAPAWRPKPPTAGAPDYINFISFDDGPNAE